MGSAGMDLHLEAERIRQALRDPRMPLGQALADAVALLTYATEQLATLEDIEQLQVEIGELEAEIQRLRAENLAMRDIVQAVASAGSRVVQYGRHFGVRPYCSFPGCDYEMKCEHTSNCPVSKAKAFHILYPG